jgi:hypothetical protein
MELHMRNLVTAAAFTIALTAPASADLIVGVRAEAPAPVTPDTTNMMHNGSEVAVTQDFNGAVGKTQIAYSKPRAGLSATPGTLLFTGTYDSKRNWYQGYAFVFKKGCDPIAYGVTGTQTGAGIALVGPAPRRATNSCEIEGYASPRDKSWTLFFEAPEVD